MAQDDEARQVGLPTWRDCFSTRRNLRLHPPRTLAGGLLGIILIVAASFRFSYSDWDGGYQLHPDERAILFVAQTIRLPASISQVFDAGLSRLNPYRDPDGSERSFPYGHVPLYVTVAAQRLIAHVCQVVDLCRAAPPGSFAGHILNTAGLSTFDQLTYVGRAVSALFDTLTVLVAFLVALELFGSWPAALLSSALLSLTVLHIQNAHFGTVDSPLAFFCTLSLWLVVRYATHHRSADSILAGVTAGLAVGCKASGLLLAIPILAAHLGFGCDVSSLRDIQFPRVQTPRAFWLTVVAAVSAFALTNPFTILDARSFASDLSLQVAMVVGTAQPAFVLQYGGIAPLWYSMGQLNGWAFGLPLALAAYAGLGWGLWQAYSRRSRPWLVVMSWAIAALVIASSGSAKFPRYLLPVTPSLVVLAAGFLTIPQRISRQLKVVLSGGVLLVTAANAAAFMSMYQSPHPWIAASQWIYASLPTDSRLVGETNDDVLPLDLSAQDGYHVRDLTYHTQLIDPLAEPDDCAKIHSMATTLAGSDDMLIASDRLYGVIPRLGERYPLTSTYFQKLLSGSLGYVLERTWYRYPNLFGWAITDGSFGAMKPRDIPGLSTLPTLLDLGQIDESFTVYDHPLVLLFRNRLRLNSKQLMQAILGDRTCPAE